MNGTYTPTGIVIYIENVRWDEMLRWNVIESECSMISFKSKGCDFHLLKYQPSISSMSLKFVGNFTSRKQNYIC